MTNAIKAAQAALIAEFIQTLRDGADYEACELAMRFRDWLALRSPQEQALAPDSGNKIARLIHKAGFAERRRKVQAVNVWRIDAEAALKFRAAMPKVETTDEKLDKIFSKFRPKAGQDISKPVPSPVKQTEPQAETKLIAAPNPQKTLEECIAEADQRENQPQEAKITPKDGGTGNYSAAYAAALDKAARIDAAPSIERFGLLEQLAQSGDKWVRMPQFCTGRAVGGDAGRGREIMAAAGRKSMPRWTGRKLPNGKQEAQRVWVKKEANNG